MTDILLEIFRAVVLLGLVVYLWLAGRKGAPWLHRGWNLVLTGFLLLLFGSLLDVTDNFESLNQFVVIGDTGVQAFLEKVVGYLGGFIVLAAGIGLWVPAVQRLAEDSARRTRELREKNDALSAEIAKRETTERALVRSEMQYRDLFEGSLQGIYIHQDGRLVFVNDAIVAMLGYDSRDDMLALDHVDELWFGEGERDRMIDYRERRKRGDPSVPDIYEVRCCREDGQPIDFIQSARMVEWHDRVAIQCVAVDITALKRAQAATIQARREAEAANAAKSQFLAAMSHDLRTPLNAIIGFAEAMRAEYFGPIDEHYRDYANDIHSSGQLLLSLVDEVLDLSLIEAGGKSLDLARVDAARIVEDCRKVFRVKAASADMTFLASPPPEGTMFHADPRAVTQIVYNLLGNALKFTPEGGTVSLAVSDTGGVGDGGVGGDGGDGGGGDMNDGGVTFIVGDTGPGFDTEQMARILEPFARGRDNPFVTDEGWGLGLSIVKSLVELHDGDLAIESQVGRGTTVSVTFPKEPRPKEPRPKGPKPKGPKPKEPKPKEPAPQEPADTPPKARNDDAPPSD